MIEPFLCFHVPIVECHFCISFGYDFTFWWHFTSGFLIAWIGGLRRPKIGFWFSVGEACGYGVATGCCSAQGFNLLDWIGSIIGAFLYALVVEIIDRAKP